MSQEWVINWLSTHSPDNWQFEDWFQAHCLMLDFYRRKGDLKKFFKVKLLNTTEFKKQVWDDAVKAWSRVHRDEAQHS